MSKISTTPNLDATAKLIAAKLTAWEQTPADKRPQDIKDQCLMNIEPGAAKWPDYLEDLQLKAHELGVLVSDPVRINTLSDGLVVLVCEVSRKIS